MSNNPPVYNSLEGINEVESVFYLLLFKKVSRNKINTKQAKTSFITNLINKQKQTQAVK